jgi:carboxypeptidase Q
MSRGLQAVIAAALVAACTHSSQQTVVLAGDVARPAPRAVAGANDTIIAKMIQEGTQHSHVDADLEYLLDVIGPRLTGSAEMRRANEWTQQKFREYGMDRADLESWKFGVGWTRGPISIRMTAPQQRELLGVSWAWAPGTDGPLAGDVVLMDARTESDWDRRFGGKLRGKWVMVGPAYPNVNPDGPPLTHTDSVHLDSLRKANQPRTNDERQFSQYRETILWHEQVGGLIRDGGKEFGLFTMSGTPEAVLPHPQIVISNDDYSQFQRLIRRGERVAIEVDIKNSLTRDVLMQYNTVAEIRGADKPDEVVLLGAHLDSWDLATGGTDNGTGAIAVLEAARILAASGARPSRTIRFVLFSGEEEGLLGSQAYVAAHEKEMNKIQAVLVLDNGTGRITGMALQGRDELREMWLQLFEPLKELGPLGVHSAMKTGTDHLSFQVRGVPAFNYDQLTRGYNHTHHSQVDDYDHTVPTDIAQAATIMAVNAWQLANMPQLLPRGPKQ